MVFNMSIVGSIMKQVSLCCTTYDTHSMLVALANSYGISSPDAQEIAGYCQGFTIMAAE